MYRHNRKNILSACHDTGTESITVEEPVCFHPHQPYIRVELSGEKAIYGIKQ